MWVRLSENRNLAVGSDHSRRMLEDPFEVRLVDGVKDPAAPAIFDNPQSSFGSVFNRRLGSAHASTSADSSRRAIYQNRSRL